MILFDYNMAHQQWQVVRPRKRTRSLDDGRLLAITTTTRSRVSHLQVGIGPRDISIFSTKKSSLAIDPAEYVEDLEWVYDQDYRSKNPVSDATVGERA